MKKARIVNKKLTGNDSAESNGEDSPVINTEITRAKPVKFTGAGITVFQRITKPTDEGLESEVRKPVLFDGRGRHINSESDLQGECHVCHKIVSLIFHCCFQGCKILLCEEHVFIFNESYHCKQHYDEVILNYDTWQLQRKVNDGKHLRENK